MLKYISIYQKQQNCRFCHNGSTKDFYEPSSKSLRQR